MKWDLLHAKAGALPLKSGSSLSYVKWWARVGLVYSAQQQTLNCPQDVGRRSGPESLKAGPLKTHCFILGSLAGPGAKC